MPNYPVSVTFDDGLHFQEGHFDINAILLSALTVTSNPAKMVYRSGERISYAGLAVTALYTDEATVDVTSRCSILPLENSLFDGDTLVEISYSEGQDVQSATLQLMHLYITALNIAQQPNKTVYKTGEIISYAGLAVTALYSDGSTLDVTASCSISPAAGKAFNPDTDTQVEISYDDAETVTAALSLTANTVTSISVTSNPLKTWYRQGEFIDYTGLAVTAAYSDGSTADVTSLCSITPADGKAFDSSTDSSVDISFVDNASISLPLHELYLSGLSVASNPDKTSYRYGENIDYTGLAVTASYSDGSSVNVTSSCVISPKAGKAFNPNTDTNVSISYSEIGSDGLITENTEIILTAVSLSALSITSYPLKTAYVKGEHIDYSGLAVTASYSDGSTENVTSSCSISPATGKAFDPDSDSSVLISYTEGETTETASLSLSEIYLTGLLVTTNPRKTAYKHDERISYAGLVVTATYSDGSSNDVTSKCSITPKSNKKFDADTDTYAEITYSQGQDEASCSLSLTPIILTALAVTTHPDNTVYSSGEPISYSGIVVTASYSDNSQDDVTDLCVFSPHEGKSFSPNSDSIVTITYSEGQSQQSCTLTLAEASPMTLVVAAMPSKTNYNPGEALDFTGAVINARFQDGTVHTVTNYCDFSSEVTGTEIKVTASCAHPATPYVFDLNSGYVDNGTWKVEQPTRTYIDIYEVKAGHKYLLTLDENVGSRFRAMFTTTDVSKASANVSGSNIINTNNPAVYASVEYTPSSNGYIVVGKDNVGKSGVKTYLYDAKSSNKNVTAQFYLTTIAVTSLSVTKPVKTRYRTGENFDYTGAIVTAEYSDGSIVNVTENASFSPANGSTAVSENTATIVITRVLVSYGGLYAGFDITMGGVAIMSLSVTPPNKTDYRTGETIDYTGCQVTAVYWDGTAKDVTASAVFMPANGTPVSAYDIDKTHNLAVSISYQEIDETLCSNVELYRRSYDYNYVDDKEGQYMDYASTYSIQPTVMFLDTETGQIGTKTFSTADFNEAPRIDSYLSEERYSDLLANGRWSGYWTYVDGESVYVKTSLDYRVVAVDVYTFGGFSQVDGQFGYFIQHFHDLYPENVFERMGAGEATVDWFAENFCGRFSLGETFVPLMTVYYDAHASYNLNFTVATLQPQLLFSMPDKTVYHYREALEFTGYSATAVYSNGDTEDVTALVTFSPRAGSTVTSSENVRVYYSNAGDDSARSSFEITVLRLSRIAVTSPEKSSYRPGEAIDYTGATVTAVYSDGSMLDVTSSAVFSPAAGTVITENMTVSVSFTDQWSETASGNLSLNIITE